MDGNTYAHKTYFGNSGEIITKCSGIIEASNSSDIERSYSILPRKSGNLTVFNIIDDVIPNETLPEEITKYMNLGPLNIEDNTNKARTLNSLIKFIRSSENSEREFEWPRTAIFLHNMIPEELIIPGINIDFLRKTYTTYITECRAAVLLLERRISNYLTQNQS